MSEPPFLIGSCLLFTFMFLSNFVEKCSLISSSITEGSIEGQNKCYEEFSGLRCPDNWTPGLFLLDNSLHYLADNFYCDVIQSKSRERMAVTVWTLVWVSNGGVVLRSSRPAWAQSGRDGVATVPGDCACARQLHTLLQTRLQTTDSPLQNNQSKSLPDNWSVHCWRHRHSLEWGWSLVQRYSRDYLIGCEC